MRILGIDYGEKKIGIAISDERAKFAFPHGVIDNTSANLVLNVIKIICDKNNVGKIIIGQSLDFKMEPNPIMKRVEKFKSFLEERLKIPIEYENEILTTKQAERRMAKARPPPATIKYSVSNSWRKKKQREKTHTSAAALILQSYLDKQKMIK